MSYAFMAMVKKVEDQDGFFCDGVEGKCIWRSFLTV
jgi:hypothetical protein